MSACAVSAGACAGELLVAVDTVDTAHMESACSVSADRAHSQTWRRDIRRAAMRSARSRAGNPCSRLGLHFAGFVSALGTVLVGRGGLECIARIVVEVVRDLPGRSVGWNYNTAVGVLFPTCWMSSQTLAKVLLGITLVAYSS